MTEKQYRLNKWGTRLLKNNRPLFDWMNDSDEVVDLLNQLNEENEQLRTKNNAYIQDIEVFKEENTHLKLENEELRQRNDRQAKRLDNLYRLIEEKDWRTLSDILDDFKRCEEQLQRESGTYGELE